MKIIHRSRSLNCTNINYSLWALKTAYFSKFLLDSNISFTSGLAVTLKWLNTEEYLCNMCHIRVTLNYPFAARFIYIIFQNLVTTVHTPYVCFNDSQSVLFWNNFSVNTSNYNKRINTSHRWSYEFLNVQVVGKCSNNYIKGFIGKVLCGLS